MNIKSILIIAGVIVSFYCGRAQSGVAPQHGCGTLPPGQNWENEFTRLVNDYKQSHPEASQAMPVLTIPVIIHVIHGGQAVGTYPNLAQGQLTSQIRVLNEDFGGIGRNYWNYPPSAFSNWAVNQMLPSANIDALGRVKIANCGVQFCLATTDTLGNVLPEPGIDRVNYIAKNWSNPGSKTNYTSFKNIIIDTVKPGTIWNTNKYFNMWVTDISSGIGLLGFATFPLLNPSTALTGIPSGYEGSSSTDGVWCSGKYFGSKTYFPSGSYASTPNVLGRVVTHETGHWLGLRHIWGDGACATDYCNDTPTANGNNGFTTPVYPHGAGSCANNSPDGEMYMNYMDYCDESFQFMYSPDQATRIQTTMMYGVYRKFLGTHNLCSLAPITTTASFNMPASVCLSSAVVTLSNMTNGTPVPSYTWSAVGPGTPIFKPNASSALAVTFSTAGTYTVTLVSGNGSGTSTASKVITIIPAPDVTISVPSQTVCYDEDIHLTATGANSYVWQPDSIIGGSATYKASASAVYTCYATGNNNCKGTSTISINVSQCTGLSSVGRGEGDFRVYPNPANNKMFVRMNTESEQEVEVEIMDALGKLVKSKVMRLGKNSQEGEIIISDIPAGVYSIKLSPRGGKNEILKMVKY